MDQIITSKRAKLGPDNNLTAIYIYTYTQTIYGFPTKYRHCLASIFRLQLQTRSSLELFPFTGTAFPGFQISSIAVTLPRVVCFVLGNSLHVSLQSLTTFDLGPRQQSHFVKSHLCRSITFWENLHVAVFLGGSSATMKQPGQNLPWFAWEPFPPQDNTHMEKFSGILFRFITSFSCNPQRVKKSHLESHVLCVLEGSAIACKIMG